MYQNQQTKIIRCTDYCQSGVEQYQLGIPHSPVSLVLPARVSSTPALLRTITLSPLIAHQFILVTMDFYAHYNSWILSSKFRGFSFGVAIEFNQTDSQRQVAHPMQAYHESGYTRDSAGPTGCWSTLATFLQNLQRHYCKSRSDKPIQAYRIQL